MNLSPAISQKAGDRPISFILDVNGSQVEEVKLFIRPEDLSVTFPSRTSVNQTLGGAWIDSFGEGLETITISGITGWRTAEGQDGIGRCVQMKQKLYTTWHKEREKAVAAGKDPNEVKLRYVDTLNRISRIVTPNVFEMRRSKSQPLLIKYRFSMTAVGKPAFSVTAPGGLGGGFGFGLSSLLGSIGKITAAINSVKNFVDRNILGPVRSFMSLTSNVLGAVHGAISAGRSIADSLVGAARGLTQAGLNVFRTLAAVASIPSQARAALMEVAGAFSNAYCVLKNALKKTPTYEDYSPLYGASNCSSTSGGMPPSRYLDQNAFAAVHQQDFGSVQVTPAASAAMSELAQRDIVASPIPLPAIGPMLSEVTAGMVIR